MDLAVAVARGRFPMSRVGEALGVSRSQLHARTVTASRPRGPYRKAEDDELLPAIRRLVDERPTYGYRQIAALLNRERQAAGLLVVNRKRVLRIMRASGLTLERSTGRREGGFHDGNVAVMGSNPRWCSGVLEVRCWNGKMVRRPSSSEPSTASALATQPSRAPASRTPTSATCAGRRRGAVRRRPRPAPLRASLLKRLVLHRQGRVIVRH